MNKKESRMEPMNNKNGKRVLVSDGSGLVVIGTSGMFGNVVKEKVVLFDIGKIEQDLNEEGRVLIYNRKGDLVAIARDVEEVNEDANIN